MAVVLPASVEEALQSSRKEPSARTQRTRQIEQDVRDVADIVMSNDAAVIAVGEEDGPVERYISALRAAMRRAGYDDILLQKKRGRPQIVAWRKRAEDEVSIERRRQHGARLGQLAKQRTG